MDSSKQRTLRSALSFPQRAVRACVNAMRFCRVSPRHVADVLKYRDVDVTPIERFLSARHSVIRRAAIRIVGEVGDVRKLIEVARRETESAGLRLVLRYIGKRLPRGELKNVMDVLCNENPLVREEAIQMYRRRGMADCLFALLFEDDDALVDRVKKYIEEQDAQEETGRGTVSCE